MVTDFARICRWLGLPTGEWPPDHYTLLGLEKGDTNPSRLEAKVQERLRLVRSYQLSHPDLATEAMNRLAEAFACLNDPTAKRRYDEERGISAPLPSHPGQSSENPATSIVSTPTTKASDDTNSSGFPTVLEWSGATPPPVRHPDPNKAPIPPVPVLELDPRSQETTNPATKAETPASPPPPSNEPPDPILAAAKKSWRASKGLWSGSLLAERLGFTETLLQGWLQLGRILSSGKGNLSPDQRKEFLGRLSRMERLREELPGLLGEPGQPGYRVAILAQDENPIQAFQQMAKEERQLLAQDWKTSISLLRAHLEFLQSELGELKGERFLSRCFRPLRAFMSNRPGWCLAFLLLFLVAASVVGVLLR